MAAAGVWLALVTCGGDGAPLRQDVPDLPPAPAGVLELPVRIHLLQSDSVESLHATLTDDEVLGIVAGVDRLWAPADIRWRVEAIVREPASAQERVRAAERAGRPPDRSLLQALVPTSRLLAEGWDVFIAHRLRGPPGLYFHRMGAVLTSEMGPDRRRASPNMIRVLAHELGHALGLRHVRCPDGGNLMAPGCPPLDGGPLEAEQIDAARRTAHHALNGSGNDPLR